MAEQQIAGDMPGYETTFITSPAMTDEALATLKTKVAGIITEYKGELVLTEDWGKRKLAYPIHNETRGHYTYIAYSGKPGVVTEIERNLRLNEFVVRFLTVKLDSEFVAEEFTKKRTDQLAAIKRREEERQARRDERRSRERGDDYGGGYGGGGYGGGGRDRGEREYSRE